MRFEMVIRNTQKEKIPLLFVGFYSTIMAKYFPVASEDSSERQLFTGAELVKTLKEGTEKYYDRLRECGRGESFVEKEKKRLEGLWGKNYVSIHLDDTYEIVDSEVTLCFCEIS